MSKLNKIHVGAFAASVSALALVVSAPAYAQDRSETTDQKEALEADGITSDDPLMDGEKLAAEESANGTEGTAIIVTGSRIQRDQVYSSLSPLQTLSTETLQDTGQFDAASILQQSVSAAGQQIDATFQGFVLNNGPGSQTLNLRGLGADRTLLLINGRRMAPAGVEGAPTNPSINLLPSSLIARYDLLLDGASSVYGSDAIAGVGNIVLRRDLDGLELFGSGSYTQAGGQNDWQVSAAWGKRGSNWQIGVGAEYTRRGEVQLRDRPFLSGCDRNYEITDTGEIRTIDVATNANVLEDSGGTVTTSESACKITGISGRIQINSTYFGSVYYDPAGGNTGIPGFSESTDAFGVPVDANGDGVRDVDFQKVNTNAAEPDVTFISPQDLYNVMAYGEYTFDGPANITPYFEANYSRADVTVTNSGTGQLFPWVPASNPFNPCNLNNPNGVDCSAADNNFNGLLPGTPYAGFALPTGRSLAVRPIVAVRGDRNNVRTRQEQFRGVFGVRGDLPFINFGVGNDWTFDVSGVYSHARGSSVRRGIRGDKLAFALGIDPTAPGGYNYGLTSPPLLAVPCDAASLRDPSVAAPDLIAGCVPVNMFAPSLLNGAIGDFATEEERNYVFGERSFVTTYDQLDIMAFVQGGLFKLPGGVAKGVIGGEFRKDKLNSIPDRVAAEGLFWGYFADQGAVGSKRTVEAFGEIDLPLVSGQTLVDDFRANISTRMTNDEFYGWNQTYSVKLGWRPVSPLLLKMAFGTSFRAPNLRENFLAGQSGFGNVLDPCAVPDAAYSALNGGYDASKDTREPSTLANCVREGRDPTRVGIDAGGVNTIQTSSAEITTGGSFALQPETSDSFTTGFSFDDRIGPIDFSFNFNYYNIRISGAIAEPTAQYIVNQCFERQNPGRSRFCDFISYNSDPDSRQLVTDVFAGFVNINKESVRGIDLNMNIASNARMFDEDVRLGLNVRANHLLDRNTLVLDDSGVPDLQEEAGTFGYPSWTGRATFTARVKRVTFTWETRYIGPVSQLAENVDEFSDAFDNNGTGFFGDTCLGSGSPSGAVPGDGVLCRDVGFADAYFMHTASVRYSADKWEARIGVRNLFDTAPPLVDSNEVLAIANTPIGNGYDLNGRQFFASMNFKF